MAKKRAPVEPAAPVEEVAQAAPAVPRYNAEGVLLNPEDFNVTADGLLRPKAGA